MSRVLKLLVAACVATTAASASAQPADSPEPAGPPDTEPAPADPPIDSEVDPAAAPPQNPAEPPPSEPTQAIDVDAITGAGDPAVPSELASDPAPAAADLDLSKLDTPMAPQLTSYVLAGTLIDDEDVLRSFLRPILSEYSLAWTPENQAEVIDFLRRLSYYTRLENQRTRGGVRATITLEPVTLVRHIKFEINKPTLERFVIEPIFADSLRRRLTLRPGSALAPGREARSEQLRLEAERLAVHLRHDGYFDAAVTISSRPQGKYAADLEVEVTPGSGYTVGEIQVIGNTEFSAERIASVFRHKRCLVWRLCAFERRFTRDQLAKDIETIVTMYQRRGHPGVRVRTDFDMRSSFKRETNSVEFTVEIRERRRIDVVFVGNTGEFTELKLAEVLTFSSEGAYDDVEVATSAAAIQSYYQSKGYFQATVTAERVPLGHDVEGSEPFDRIYFYIDEGPKMPIRSVTFAGNKVLSNAALQEAIKSRVFRSFIIGDSGGYATTLQLEQDVERLVQLYRQKGFLAARVSVRAGPRPGLLDSAPALAAAVAAGEISREVHVQFVIDEGPRSEVARVEFEFPTPNNLPIEDLLRVTRVKAGQPYLEERAQDDARKLANLYFARGYPRARIEPRAERAEDLPNQVVVIYTVEANAEARVGKVALRGNFKTRQWVILDELGLAEGQLLTLAAEDRAQRNLQATGLFSAVKLDYIGHDNPRRKVVNLVVNVEERFDSRGEIEAAIGASTDRGYFVGGGYKHFNIGGMGLRFDADLLYGSQETRAEARVALPRWIMRRALSTTFVLEASALYIREKIERFGDLQTLGATLAGTKRGREGFFRDWLFTLRYDFRQRNRDRELVRPAGAAEDIRADKVTTRSSTFGPALAIDRRRNREGSPSPLAPSQGYYFEVRGQYGENLVLGTDRFIKLGGSAQYYLPLGGRFLVSNSVRYDHGIPLGGASLLPDVERYFAGGDTTVRGFEEDQLATEIIEDSLSPLGSLSQFRVLPAGGNVRFIHNVELQVELWELTEGVSIASALFLDTGVVANSLDGFKPSDLRHSVGMTILRFSTPVGRIGVEWGVPLDPKLGDNPIGRFHFNIGFAN
jgi:outer membrane protein insertion porin family